MTHVLARGYEDESRRSGGSGGDTVQDEHAQYYATSSPYQQYQTVSYGSGTNSNGGDDYSYQDMSTYYYDLDQNNGQNSHHQT